ncbi:hypothetical protein MVES_001419 [Malassezia vespertilionis]|uniref:RRM domain-containing protein n=1 Tax=Malassezia vespertilionis TaxID=2020962 RepID=A0A2N1JDC9_9BASI|nr:hypothetical protein MVES_001419 [Malassezia vespertilionis]
MRTAVKRSAPVRSAGARKPSHGKVPISSASKSRAAAPVKKVTPLAPKPKKRVRIHEAADILDAKKARKATVESEEEDDATLEGFDEPDSDSEDAEDDVLATRAAPSVGEIVRLPNSRDDAVVRQRLDQAKSRHAERSDGETGVVYIGRLPHGFFETQLKAYFSQFGDIRRLRLSRNKKTGHSKHYAFIEFDAKEVAEIVVDTMNNYLLDGHLVQMAMIPDRDVNPNMWIGANRTFRKVPTDRIERLSASA